MKNKIYKLLKSIQLRLRIIKSGRKIKKVVIGSGGVYQKGWIPTNMETIRITVEKDWAKYFKEGSIDIVLAEHVWEHLTEKESENSARIIHKYLKKGGCFRIAVPDGYHPNPNYIKGVDVSKDPKKLLLPESHKVLYNYKTLSSVFENAGFKVKLLEYFDENGDFQFNEWNAEEGMIYRSLRYKNLRKDVSIFGMQDYTSLILDVTKE